MTSMFEDMPEIDTSKTLQLSLGLASPLWMPFLGAASAGVAFWWMTRWMQSANLEAMLQVVEPIVPTVDLPEVVEANVEMLQAATDQVEAAADEAVSTTTEIAEAATASVDHVTDAVIETADETTDVVVEAAEKTTDAMVETADKATEVVVETADKATDAVVKTAATAKKKAKAATEAPLH